MDNDKPVQAYVLDQLPEASVIRESTLGSKLDGVVQISLPAREYREDGFAESTVGMIPTSSI